MKNTTRALLLGLCLGLLASTFAGCNAERPPCTPNNCTGCCDEADVCHPGDAVTACGVAGSACINCAPYFCGTARTCGGQPPVDAGGFDANGFEDPRDGSMTYDGGFDDDAGRDAGFDGGVDAGDDAGFDAGGFDAGRDAGPGFDAGFPAGLYVSPRGFDTNLGTRASPFLTINHAAAQAAAADAGVVIWLLDGRYDVTTQPNYGRFGAGTRIPHGTAVRAEVPGQVTLQGDLGIAFIYEGSGALSGVTVEDFTDVLQASTGQLVVQDVQFTRTSGLSLTGTVQAVLLPGTPGENLIVGTSGLVARLSNNAGLTVTDMRVEGVPNQGGSNSGLFTAINNSSLTLDRVTLQNNTHSLAVVASGNASLTVRDSTIIAPGSAVYVWHEIVPGRTQVRIERSTLIGDFGVVLPPFTGANADVVIEDSVITDAGQNAIGLRSGLDPTVVVRNSAILNSYEALQMTSGGQVRFENSRVEGCITGLTMSGSAYELSMRNSSVVNNARSGLRVLGIPGSVDLGTASDAGNNTLRGNNPTGVGEANLFLSAIGLVQASGNRWDRNTQGSDDGGFYAPLPDGGPVDVTPVTSGPNFRVNQGTLRLAE